MAIGQMKRNVVISVTVIVFVLMWISIGGASEVKRGAKKKSDIQEGYAGLKWGSTRHECIKAFGLRGHQIETLMKDDFYSGTWNIGGRSYNAMWEFYNDQYYRVSFDLTSSLKVLTFRRLLESKYGEPDCNIRFPICSWLIGNVTITLVEGMRMGMIVYTYRPIYRLIQEEKERRETGRAKDDL